MHALIFCFGTRGDVQPYVALGAALSALGHTVTLATGQGFDALITRHGLRPHPLSIDYRKLLEDPTVQAAMRTLSGKLRTARQMRGELHRQHDEMWEAARTLRPDVLIASPKAFAATLIAKALEIPCVSTTLQPNFAPTGAFPPFLIQRDGGPWLNRSLHRLLNWLTRVGQNRAIRDWARATLPKPTAIEHFFGHHPSGRRLPLLHGYGTALVPRPADWGPEHVITGAWFLPDVSGEALPAPLSAFLDAGPPPVYVGFGSMPSGDAERVTRMVVAALEARGLRGVLASGWGGLSSSAGSERLFVLSSARHDLLFPRCAAVVHHGGAGTTHEGLRWGRPTVICPIGMDQPFWGRRVAALGAGSAPIVLERHDVTSLTRALDAALRDDVRDRAAAVGASIRAEGGAAEAAAHVVAATTAAPAPGGL